MADAEVELGEQNGQFPRVLDAVDKNEGPRDVRFPDKVRQDLRLFQRILDIHETLFQLRGRRELLQYGRVFGLLLLGGPQDIFGFDDAGEEFRLKEVHPEQDLLLIQKFVRRMKGSKRTIVNGPIFEKVRYL